MSILLSSLKTLATYVDRGVFVQVADAYKPLIINTLKEDIKSTFRIA